MKFLMGIKDFEFRVNELVTPNTIIKFKKGEFEIKELFRIFCELKNKLPDSIDKSIFGDSNSCVEPREFEDHSDPKFTDHQYSTNDLLNMKEFTIDNQKVSSEKFTLFIKWCESLYNSGQIYQTTREDVEKIAMDSSEIGRGDFSDFVKDNDLIVKLKSSSRKAKNVLRKSPPLYGHGSVSNYETGLFNKYPDFKKTIQNSWTWDYYKNTWHILDKKIKNGEEIAMSSILVIDGKWYLVGGNRRMAYYLCSGINPKIWIIKQ